MSKLKGKWRSLGLPQAIVRRVRAVLPYTGNQSLAEYARVAIQERLRFDEQVAEESREQEKEIQSRLKD